ncbi:hypothetical protein ACWFR5_37210 [Streptomyces sp. NPDC055092]
METAVRLWVSQAEVDVGEKDGLTSSEREELAAMRRENRRLREGVDIPERATAPAPPSMRPAAAESPTPVRSEALS